MGFNYKDQSVSVVLDRTEYINTLQGENAIFLLLSLVVYILTTGP